VLIYRSVATKDDCLLLQKVLTTLENWEHKWNMCFSPLKCAFLRVTNKRDVTHFRYFIQNIEICEVQQAKYLGVTLNNNSKWSDHIQIISNKANSVLGFLHQNFNTCPTKVKSALYTEVS